MHGACLPQHQNDNDAWHEHSKYTLTLACTRTLPLTHTYTRTNVAQLLHISVFHTTHEKDQGQLMSVAAGQRRGSASDIGRWHAVSTD